jgi:ribonuclease-3
LNASTPSRRAEAIQRLEYQLGHRFHDRTLLERALTHASARGRARSDNEKLEFLGDRVLGLIIAAALAEENRDADVGVMSRRLHSLTNGPACARVAKSAGVGDALRMAAGETRRGARSLDTILGDACEALIAALFLELGFVETSKIVLRLWSPLLAERMDADVVDPKTVLQEWAAANGRDPPGYRVIDKVGPDHAPMFTVEASIQGEPPENARASAVRAAEKAAALALLRRLRPSP